MSELVSVIITTYKRNDLLPRAISSVLNQSYHNVEVIVVDDNDPNSEYRLATEKLIAEKYGTDERVHYVKMPKNSGACIARNRGVDEAQGVFINFLDDDDEFFPQKIERQMEIFKKQPELSVVGCYAEIVDENGNIKGYEQSQISGDVFFCQLCQNITTTSLSLIKKNVYVQSGGFEQMFSSQEHWMFAKIYAINPNYNYVPLVLVRLYHHSGERISTNRNKPLGAIELSEKVKIYYPRLKVDEQQLLEGRMQENIIFAFLNAHDQASAKKYYNQYRNNTSINKKQKIKVHIMCLIGINNYRKLLKLGGKNNGKGEKFKEKCNL